MGLGELIKAAIGGVIGGAIGAAIWVAVVYFTNYEIGWIAWGVGITTGLGVAAACKDGEMVTGVLAAMIAIVALLAGKYMVVEITFGDGASEFLEQYRAEVTDETLIDAIAEQIIEEREAAGEPIDWPDIPPAMPEEMAAMMYPDDVLAEAKARWEGMLPSEQDDYREAHLQYVEDTVAYFDDEIKKEGFKESFGVLDIVFFGLALASAFKLGYSGGLTEN